MDFRSYRSRYKSNTSKVDLRLKTPRLSLSVFIFLCVVWSLYLLDTWYDRKYTVAVVGSAPIYSDWYILTPTSTSLVKGEQLKVLRLRYGKDYIAFLAKREDGSMVWVINDEAIAWDKK